MKELLIGVVGCGGRGRLAHLAHDPANGVKVVAGADIRPEPREYFKGRYGEEAFVTSDYRDLLRREDIDAVFVTTPDFLHEEHAVAAMRAGKAVYLEKPLATSLESCDRILKVAYETKAKLYVGHNMRHMPAVLKMRELIAAGMVGDVQSIWCRHGVSYGGDAYFKDWHAERRCSNSLLLQKGSHDIDVIHWLAGGYTRTVVGMGKLSVYDQCPRRGSDQPRQFAEEGKPTWTPTTKLSEQQTDMNPVIDVEDHNMILMQLDNGVQASYMECHYTPDSMRNYNVIGTKGRMENIGIAGDCEIIVHNRRQDGHGDPDISYRLKASEGDHGGSDAAIVKEFVGYVKDGGTTSTSPVAARYAVAVGALAADSIRSDNCLRLIPPLDEKLTSFFK